MCQVFFVGDSLFAETLSQTLVSGEKVVIIGGESRACYEACVLLQAPTARSCLAGLEQTLSNWMEDIMNRKKLSYALKLFLAMALVMFAAQTVLAKKPGSSRQPSK